MNITRVIPFFGYAILDRMAFYGLRSILLLFLLEGFLDSSFKDALGLYSLLTSTLIGGFVVGGLLGLINQPKLVTLFGIVLKISGTIVLVSTQTESGIMVAFVLIAIGTGITRTNDLTFLGQIYKRSNLLSSGLMLNYLIVYLGALIGPVFLSFVSEEFNFKTGLIVVTVLYLLSGIVLLFAKNNATIISAPVKKCKVSYIPVILVLAIVGVVFYWSSNNYMTDILYNKDMDMPQFILDGQNIANGMVFMLTIFFAIYLTYKKITTTLLLGIGFFAALLSVLIIGVFNYVSLTSYLLIFLMSLFFFFSSIAEVFLIVPLHTFIVRKFNSKYSPFVFAALLFIVQIVFKLQTFFKYEFSLVKLIVYALLMLVFSGVFFILNRKYKKSNEIEDLKEF